MLEKDLDAHQNEYDAPQKLCTRFILGAEQIAHLHADRRKKEGYDADKGHRRADVDLGKEGKGDAYDQGVDAGSDRHGQHCLDTEGAARFLPVPPDRLADHIQTDSGEQN